MATGDDTHNEIKGASNDAAKLEAIKEDFNGEIRFVVESPAASEKNSNKERMAIPFGLDEEGEIGVDARVVPPLTSTIHGEKEKRAKLGHRRIGSDGRVTYKDVLSCHIVESIRLGIEHAVTGSVSKVERDLLMQDFMIVETTPFSSTGTSRFMFKTYAPVAFAHFRELFGIGPDDFLASFFSKPLKELSDSGKSGSIFYLTGDDRFIVKTMQSKECSFLQKLLPGYYMNVHQNPNTLLPKYFGLYCYRCDSKKIKLVAMNNILPSSIDIALKYDLKGATYKGRVAQPDAPSAYKDLDFLLHHPSGLVLGNDAYDTLMATIKRDCTVLESFKIMDYSLLLGVCKVDSRNLSPTHGRDPEAVENVGRFVDGKDTTTKHRLDRRWLSRRPDTFPHGGLPALDGRGTPILIFVGIIDILQSYRLKKRFEHAWKSLIHDGDTVSVHRPDFYSSRFQTFMTEKVFKRFSIPGTKHKTWKQVGGKLREHLIDDGQPAA